MNSNYLVLVRHGQSEWNEKNLFTGWRDPGLTQRGIEEAHKAGILLRDKGLIFDLMFTSELQRAQLTGQIMLDEMGCSNLQTTIFVYCLRIFSYFPNIFIMYILRILQTRIYD